MSSREGLRRGSLFHPKFMTSTTILNFPFLYGDVPRQPSYGVYISQLIRLLESKVMRQNLILEIKVLQPNL